MPLREYEVFFGPDQVDTMAAAFETAWQELTTSLGPAKSEEEIQALRKKLAECIVISALDVSHEAPDEVAREALECLHEGQVMNHGEPLLRRPQRWNLCSSGVDVDESLTRRIQNLVAARYLLDLPRWWKAA